MPRYVWRSSAALTLALAAAGCGSTDLGSVRISTAGAQTPRYVTEAQAAIDASRRTALVSAADRVSPAVVSINVKSRQQTAPRSPWDFFFVPEGARVVQGYGTGFVIRPNGIIVTNQTKNRIYKLARKQQQARQTQPIRQRNPSTYASPNLCRSA